MQTRGEFEINEGVVSKAQIGIGKLQKKIIGGITKRNIDREIDQFQFDLGVAWSKQQFQCIRCSTGRIRRIQIRSAMPTI